MNVGPYIPFGVITFFGLLLFVYLEHINVNEFSSLTICPVLSLWQFVEFIQFSAYFCYKILEVKEITSALSDFGHEPSSYAEKILFLFWHPPISSPHKFGLKNIAIAVLKIFCQHFSTRISALALTNSISSQSFEMDNTYIFFSIFFLHSFKF